MQRGQSAYEFLASYGTMILILLTMFAVMMYFGIIDLDDFNPDSCVIEPEFLCDDHKVYSNGSVAFMIRNNFENMDYVVVNMTTEDCTLADDSHTETTLKQKEFMGSKDLIYFRCDGPLVTSDNFVADLSLTFLRQDRAIEHTVYGKLVTKVD